jgi:diketogulonate reductase-like aldo/keto reductase
VRDPAPRNAAARLALGGALFLVLFLTVTHHEHDDAGGLFAAITYGGGDMCAGVPHYEHVAGPADGAVVLRPKLAAVPRVALNGVAGGGLRMPRIGLGTCCRPGERGPAITRAVVDWLSVGGELVDTAELYRNHKDIGRALRCFPAGDRDRFWITSKVDMRHIKDPLGVAASVERTLLDLGLHHVDLMLLHQSECGSGSGGGDDDGLQCVVDAWRELLRLQTLGKARAVGVSNFGVRHLEALARAGLPYPAVNEIEFHPWISREQRRTFEWCNRNGVAVIAYGSLGGSKRSGGLPAAVEEVAAEVGASAHQTMLAWWGPCTC